VCRLAAAFWERQLPKIFRQLPSIFLLIIEKIGVSLRTEIIQIFSNISKKYFV
jgi:hypothetical protein